MQQQVNISKNVWIQNLRKNPNLKYLIILLNLIFPHELNPTNMQIKSMQRAIESMVTYCPAFSIIKFELYPYAVNFEFSGTPMLESIKCAYTFGNPESTPFLNPIKNSESTGGMSTPNK